MSQENQNPHTGEDALAALKADLNDSSINPAYAAVHDPVDRSSLTDGTLPKVSEDRTDGDALAEAQTGDQVEWNQFAAGREERSKRPGFRAVVKAIGQTTVRAFGSAGEAILSSSSGIQKWGSPEQNRQIAEAQKQAEIDVLNNQYEQPAVTPPHEQ